MKYAAVLRRYIARRDATSLRGDAGGTPALLGSVDVLGLIVFLFLGAVDHEEDVADEEADEEANNS